MGTARRIASRVSSLALAALLVVACTSPTLPLPPPTMPTVLDGSEPGTYRLVSLEGALPNALVIVVNRNESVSRDERVEATLADDRGSWELEIAATVGDALDVSQQSGELRSPVTTVVVR